MKIPRTIIFLLFILIIILLAGCEREEREITGNPVRNVEQELEDVTFVLKARKSYYYGGNYENSGSNVVYKYKVSSSVPVDVYVVPSQSDWKLIDNGEEFINYYSCKGIDILEFKTTCRHDNRGGIVIKNDNWQDARLTLEVYNVGWQI